MAAKVDPVEQLHFRVDEHERSLGEIRKAADSIPALVNGGVAALSAAMKAELADARADKAVAESNKEVVAQLKELIPALHELVRALCAPSTRESVVHLPSGPVRMTVKESHGN